MWLPLLLIPLILLGGGYKVYEHRSEIVEVLPDAPSMPSLLPITSFWRRTVSSSVFLETMCLLIKTCYCTFVFIRMSIIFVKICLFV